ncbi:MAG: DbpA RNA binding domain-containing protein [Treponema sp.]|jgi:hypothetical protein|nr:DbpA RNA binding domain-containing protein [Treponema sp.]
MAVDSKKIKQKIAVIREKIAAEADPSLLNEYRLLFKKEISFFRRSWAAAYLLMLYDQGTEAGKSGRDSRSRSRAKGSLREEGEKPSVRAEGAGKREGGEHSDRAEGAPPRPFLAEDESRRLFISIGRNRRVFPREILGLIINRAQVEREDIGAIRILDSYSFVQVRDTAADAIIEALNGTSFRGRTITVNYARLKREEDRNGEGLEEAASAGSEVLDEIQGDSPSAGGRSDESFSSAEGRSAEDYSDENPSDGSYSSAEDRSGDYSDESRSGDYSDESRFEDAERDGCFAGDPAEGDDDAGGSERDGDLGDEEDVEADTSRQ